MPVDKSKVERLATELLAAIGEDPNREGLLETPARFAKWWAEFIDYDAGKTETTFEGMETDQMVAVTGVRVWSLCEHHLLPFNADLTIAYIAEGRIIGLSKLARIAHKYAHGLQVQERLVTQIADHIQQATGAYSVAVLASGEHLCMTMRGIRTPARMHSSVLRGLFKHDPDTRAELLALDAKN